MLVIRVAVIVVLNGSSTSSTSFFRTTTEFGRTRQLEKSKKERIDRKNCAVARTVTFRARRMQCNQIVSLLVSVAVFLIVMGVLDR